MSLVELDVSDFATRGAIMRRWPIKPNGRRTEQHMSNVYKFDPNALRERKRLNEKTQMSAKEAEALKARKDSRKAWLLFVGAVILLTILKAILPLG
jgi:hypothetical protein